MTTTKIPTVPLDEIKPGAPVPRSTIRTKYGYGAIGRNEAGWWIALDHLDDARRYGPAATLKLALNMAEDTNRERARLRDELSTEDYLEAWQDPALERRVRLTLGTLPMPKTREYDDHKRFLPPLPKPPGPKPLLPDPPVTVAERFVARLQPQSWSTTISSLNRAAHWAGLPDGLAVAWHEIPVTTLVQIRARGVAAARERVRRGALRGLVSAPTVNHSLSAVRGCLRLAEQDETITRAERLARARVLRNLGHAGHREMKPRLHRADLRALLDVCADLHNPPAGARDAALVALVIGCGGKRADLASLQYGDLVLDQGVALIGPDVRPQALPAFAVEALERWGAFRGDHDGPLFHPVNKGRRVVDDRGMTPQALQKRCEARGREAGVAVKTTPRAIRQAVEAHLHARSTDPRITLAVRGDADPVEGVRAALDSLMAPPPPEEDAAAALPFPHHRSRIGCGPEEVAKSG
ncbi:site-specific integrase [Candidatus Palauibacter sp.]|uniref:site-specific integrase n=1 Tax=Candidatus Palauibacter sp. TaxID=3101350 RepID=UPI003C6F299B